MIAVTSAVCFGIQNKIYHKKTDIIYVSAPKHSKRC